MSRTDKDRCRHDEGYCRRTGHWARWKRMNRRARRETARQELRNGREPQPKAAKDTKQGLYW